MARDLELIRHTRAASGRVDDEFRGCDRAALERYGAEERLAGAGVGVDVDSTGTGGGDRVTSWEVD